MECDEFRIAVYERVYIYIYIRVDIYIYISVRYGGVNTDMSVTKGE